MRIIFVQLRTYFLCDLLLSDNNTWKDKPACVPTDFDWSPIVNTKNVFCGASGLSMGLAFICPNFLFRKYVLPLYSCAQRTPVNLQYER